MSKKNDPRLSDIIDKKSKNKQYNITIIGFPYDIGCKRNNGRIGAQLGPSEFRKHCDVIGTLVNCEFKADLRQLSIYDQGDIQIALDLTIAHQRLYDMVSLALQKATIPMVIGGSNDQSFPNARALIDYKKKNKIKTKTNVINIDAHLDVREYEPNLPHSGSPFRQLIESGLDGQYIVFGAQGSQCSMSHVNYIESNQGSVYWYHNIANDAVEQFRLLLDSLQGDIFVSFDIDSIRSSDCPGVSCPSPIGFFSDDAMLMCYHAGLHPRVRMMDFSEMNPLIEDYRTGRLVANMFYYFCMGYSNRPK